MFFSDGTCGILGSGIKRIMNEANEYGLEPPAFQEFDNMFRVSLYRKADFEQKISVRPEKSRRSKCYF